MPDFGLGKGLRESLRAFTRERTSPPWESTKYLFQYLKIVGPKVYVRAERPEGSEPPRSYVQLGFSGCGGTAEVSAEVGWHWARQWHNQERVSINKLLGERGFVPRPPQYDELDTDNPAFLPFGMFGYAAFVNDHRYAEWLKMAGPDDPKHRFEVDAGDGFEGEPLEQALSLADEAYASMVRTSGCRCQLCAPSFDASSVTRTCRLDKH
jgi:hypothetical protein